MGRKVVIFDLDGTLANIDHRLHFVTGPKKDWDAFYKTCVADSPNWNNLQVLHALASVGYRIVILTGRSDEVRNETIEWLNNYGVTFHGLYMRPDKDYTQDHDLKLRMMADAQQEMGFTKEEVLCIFDDRQKVVDMWRKNGYTCYQVAKGDF